MKNVCKILLLVLCVAMFAMVFVACDIRFFNNNEPTNEEVKDVQYDDDIIPQSDDTNTIGHMSNKVVSKVMDSSPKGEYNEGVVLVKSNKFNSSLLGDLEYESVEQLYVGSLWHMIKLEKGESTEEAVKYLMNLDSFDSVDYDYIMQADGEIESVDVYANPYSHQAFFETQGIIDCWNYQKENNLNVGGSPDVVVAVIDTGVDYNHIDLRNNIWHNIGEIPNNGIDDDGNGYIDDYYGWDFANDDNDPIDDNGHGTHVAGIIAAENNNIGSIGVAYSCKVMCVKAGTHSGFFTNASITRAIEYAYMNGASVINMSFGGPTISLSAEEALESAYNTCVLVASAGNDGKCSEQYCQFCYPNCRPTYPGALSYIVGVMSCNYSGTYISGFSNYDHEPFAYNKFEYDNYACGENIVSTWPNNKYASLSGTSMASPIVAGIAALLRSYYDDRELYPSKFIHSQLTTIGSKNVTIYVDRMLIKDKYHPFCNAFSSLTESSKPFIYNLYDYYIFDNSDISSINNCNGYINPGETIKLGIELQNRGGKASDVVVRINTESNDDPSLTDPNVEILNDTIFLYDIGTYSLGDCGKIIQDSSIIDMEQGFLLKINENTINGYRVTINIEIEYKNGLDENDETIYKNYTSLILEISRGIRLSGYITEDTVFDSSNEYYITDTLVITQNATVTFTEGCIITMYGASFGYIDTVYNAPKIDVYGTLRLIGTKDNYVKIMINESWSDCHFFMNNKSSTSRIYIEYADIDRMVLNTNSGYEDGCQIFNSIIKYDKSVTAAVSYLNNGYITSVSGIPTHFGQLSFCYIDLTRMSGMPVYFYKVDHSAIIIGKSSNDLSRIEVSRATRVTNQSALFSNNVVLMVDDWYSHDNPCNNKWGFGDCIDFYNNAFLLGYKPEKLSDLMPFNCSGTNINDYNNYFDKIYRDYNVSLFTNNVDGNGNINIDMMDTDSFNSHEELIWPFISSIQIINSNNEEVQVIGTEINTVRVTFSKAMDVSNEFRLYFGSWYPYSDYQIKGDYISSTIWEGTIQVKSNIEGGVQYFSSSGGQAEEITYIMFQKVLDTSTSFYFNIDTSQAYSMNLQASSTVNGIDLSWIQDDYDTLMGYNVYRSAEKDGNYVRINPTIIPLDDNKFFDENVEPGMMYWYTFTVVLSDMSESAPAGKVSCTAMDTLAPTIYHTPINQWYLDNNLTIICNATDNISVEYVVLNYRAIGEIIWKNIDMSKQNNRYSGLILGSELSLDGLEYYIVASDGVNIISKGTADAPYTVVIKDDSALSGYGDVDGDGVVTTKDALMIIQAINGDILLSDDEFRRADLNKDETLSSMEALRILQYINGNVITLEM